MMQSNAAQLSRWLRIIIRDFRQANKDSTVTLMESLATRDKKKAIAKQF